MTRFVVASRFRWDEYPGNRPGRLYAGKPDVTRSPLGEAHLVEDPDAGETLCGLPRTQFPHNFPHVTHLGASDSCPTCRAAGTS